MTPLKKIEPQPAFQMEFLSTPADIAIGGGAAGAGKSFALLLEPLRHIHNKNFGAVIFRRTSPQIRSEGGLWDTSNDIYPLIGAKPRETNLEWIFPAGSGIKFSHLEYEKNVLDWQGSQVPFLGFDELTHFCLTPDTDVLTNNGWCKINEIEMGDFVASLNSNGCTEWKRVDETYSFDFNGELKCVNQVNGISFKATLNHKAVVMKQLPNSKKTKGNLYQGWKFKEVKDLKTCYIPRKGEIGGKEKSVITFKKPQGRGHGSNSNIIEKMDVDVWLSFLGWYISEGCCFYMNNRSKSPVVSIRQTKMSNHKELIDLFNSMGFRWKYRDDGNYMIFSRQLFDILKPLGNLYEKRIPRWIYKLSIRQKKIFWDSFVSGDGHRYKNGSISIGLANEGLIDDLQELSFHIGLISTKGYQKVKNKFDVYRLSVHSPHKTTCPIIKNKDWTYEKYEGKVHCLNVRDNHTFLIRHNGRHCWTGNSEKMFFYLLSRNRSTCGVKPYVRATCNPDPDSWVANFISWWIDQDSGFPLKDRAGKLRYFIKEGDSFVWGDSKREVLDHVPHIVKIMQDANNETNPENLVKSVTFIPGDIYGNKALLSKDPGYLANLMAQEEAIKKQLLEGNWKIKIDDAELINFVKLKDTFSNSFIKEGGKKYITADIALKGSDLLVIAYWEGFRWLDVIVMEKSKGNEVIDAIKKMALKWHVPQSQILYDDDGVGQFVDGFIQNARAFKNAGKPFNDENYKYLRDQLYFKMADRINNDGYYVADNVLNKVVKGKKISEWLMDERRAIKQNKPDHDGKLAIIPKEERRNIIGRSTDFMDVWMMREWFEMALKPAANIGLLTGMY